LDRMLWRITPRRSYENNAISYCNCAQRAFTRAVTNRIVPTLRFTIPPSSSFPPPLFYSLLLPPRVMKRSFVFMLLFTLVRTARMLFSFFKPVPAKTMLRSQMLWIYDLHSVDFAYVKFMLEINTSKNLSKLEVYLANIKWYYSNFIILSIIFE